jgi:hypothetical protein
MGILDVPSTGLPSYCECLFPLLSYTATSLIMIMQTCIMSEVVTTVQHSQLTRHAKMNLFCSLMLMMATDVISEVTESLTLTSP